MRPALRPALLAALLVLSPLAGCATPPAPPPSDAYDAIEAAIGTPVVADHDHADAAVHGTHVNLDRVALLTGHEPGPAPAGESYAETAVKGGYAYLSRYGPESGLAIFDVRDIEHPAFVGALRLNAGFEPDVEVSDDGHWAFWETQRMHVAKPPIPPTPDLGAELGNGIHVIDVSDKAHPKWVSFVPVAVDGPHSITYANVGGRDLVLASAYAYQYSHEGRKVPFGQRLDIYQLETGAPVPTLRLLSEFRDPGGNDLDPTDSTGGLFPHDVSVAVHPITHRTLAYIAYWDLGVVILDVSDPANPQKVGQATDFGPASYVNMHMARQLPDLVDGRVVVVGEPEIGDEPNTGYISMLDATDPIHPTYISSWKIPGNQSSDGGNLGPHYFDVRDGRVAMASYHAGFWVFDIHDHGNLLHPRTVAYAQVNATAPGAATAITAGGADSAFDAWWADATHVLAGDALRKASEDEAALHEYRQAADKL
ncbi:MAG: LVIVD repeat-containing protein, partial [Thermoplasmatota archaeon]